MGDHVWSQHFGLTCCDICGIVKRADGNNKPCRGPMRLREPEKMRFLPVQALAKEIGATWQPDDEGWEFQVTWVKSLAHIVGDHAWPFLHKYPDKVRAWACEIVAADDGTIEDVLKRVHDGIHELDYDDGWAIDRAGSALECVCLALLPDTRWLAEASQSVWKFVTGCGAYNDIVKFSQEAWLRQLYEECAGRAEVSFGARE